MDEGGRTRSAVDLGGASEQVGLTSANACGACLLLGVLQGAARRRTRVIFQTVAVRVTG